MTPSNSLFKFVLHRLFIRGGKNSCWLAVCSLCLSLALPTSANGSDIAYFKADVPVKSQSREEQVSAAELGLLDVLVRMSGTEAVRTDDNILASTTKAISYVEQFQYLALEDEALQQQGYTFQLRLTYSPRVVRKLLGDAGQKFWSVNRPSTLVWLVEDSPEYGKQFILSTSDSELLQGMNMAAHARGVPLSFPLLDFQDQIALGAETAWALDEDAILAASERYAADVILIGKVTTTSSGQTWSNWLYLHNEQTKVFDLRDQSALKVGMGAIPPIADDLAAIYAVDTSIEEYYSVTVRNVQSFADYRGIIDVLEQLDAVAAIALDTIERDTLSIRVQSEATVDQLISMLSLRKQLYLESADDNIPVWQQAPKGSVANPLLYRWVR